MGNHHQRRRFVELLKIIHFIRSGKLLDNLAAWLEAFPPPVTCGKFGRMLSAVKKHFKITHDEARHSFISYHVAAYRSLGDAALQAGNSESIIKRLISAIH